jgi:hypothetical protein
MDGDGVPLGRPAAPGSEPPDGWEALDWVDMWDCYLCRVHMSVDIPTEFHEKWARALAEILERLNASMENPDPLALERATKWMFVIHQLLLRTDDGRVGRRL